MKRARSLPAKYAGLWACLAALLALTAGCGKTPAGAPAGTSVSAASEAPFSTPPPALSPTPSPSPMPTPTPTAAPTPTPAPTPVMGTVTLDDPDGAVNVRGGPGPDEEVIGQLKNGDPVEILRAGIRWHHVACAAGTGYITADAVSADPSALAEPVVAAAMSGAETAPGGCAQIILSLVEYDTGWVWVLEKEETGWRVALGPYAANMGRKGPGKEKAGDQKTPLGVFTPDLAFGTGGAPEGVSFPWRAITAHSLWVGDSDSRYYNLWVEDGSVTADYRLSDCERLSAIMPQYELALNYGYNPDCTPYAGSALFLHVWKAPGAATAGCTAVSRDTMLEILRRLDPGRNPVFMQWELPADG